MNETVGKNIRMLRENMGISQLTIARFLHVDISLVLEIESGERKISSDILEKLSYLFGVTVNDFESNNIMTYKWAIPNRDFSAYDLFAIADIHRIMLNSEQMAKMLEV